MTELDSDYEHAGFSGHLAFGTRPALVIVDMVMAYLDPACPLYAGDSAHTALKAAVHLRAASVAAGIPVVLSGVHYQAGGVDGGLFFKKVPALRHFEAGSPFGRFPDELAPGPNDIVLMKQYASAFFGTSLASTLSALKVDTVLIAGFSTSGCVRASALDALQHGFAPFVVQEACGDRHEAPHNSNLFDLHAKYAEVVSLEWAIGVLAARSAS
ncbi:isochorismatase family protein [Hyphomonas johnsonii]|uniref:Isochorismatase hydrolase n=1 Tax=Hyphomonas johnsonii MHS-2 TaxID=1280950 RepID=A0A059FBJ4_9PROT|nr:isochorismatase family protein [Hyphomonas johnsonii]KCZ87908.1 isochorismatase hydrolase [Hyphomonas johnsonii MHS-2]